jgi:hypothetical protein
LSSILILAPIGSYAGRLLGDEQLAKHKLESKGNPDADELIASA